MGLPERIFDHHQSDHAIHHERCASKQRHHVLFALLPCKHDQSREYRVSVDFRSLRAQTNPTIVFNSESHYGVTGYYVNLAGHLRIDVSLLPAALSYSLVATYAYYSQYGTFDSVSVIGPRSCYSVSTTYYSLYLYVTITSCGTETTLGDLYMSNVAIAPLFYYGSGDVYAVCATRSEFTLTRSATVEHFDQLHFRKRHGYLCRERILLCFVESHRGRQCAATPEPLHACHRCYFVHCSQHVRLCLSDWRA